MSEEYSVPVLRKIGYSIGHTLNDVTAAIWFSYLITYFHNVRQFDNMLAGYLMLVGQLADALFTPLIGIGSDKYGGFCLGKRQSWHCIGVTFIILSFPFIFIEVIDFSALPKWLEFLFYSVAVVLFQFGWASVQVSHLAMIPELTEVSTEKVQLNGFRYAVSVVCTLFVYLFAWLLFHLQKGKRENDQLNQEDGDVFRNLTIAVIGTGLVASIIFYILAREKKSSAVQNVSTASSKKWKDWLKFPKFYKIAVIYMCTRLVVNISQIYIPLYITDSLRMQKDYIAIVPLVVYSSQFLTSLLMRYINIKIGRKKTFCIGQICIVAACVWIYFINKDGVNQVYGVAVLIGMGGATVLVTSLAMTSDLIGKNSVSGAFVYGCVSFADKLSNGVAVVLIQFFLTCLWLSGSFPSVLFSDAFKHPFNSCNHSSESENCTYYYRNILIGVPGGVTVLAFLVLLTLVKCTQKGRCVVSPKETAVVQEIEIQQDITG